MQRLARAKQRERVLGNDMQPLKSRELSVESARRCQFEFRLEMPRSFVLSELRQFLNVGQFRLEMQRAAENRVRQARGYVQFQSRVEIARWFVLSELHRILHIDLCRVEKRTRRSRFGAQL